MSDPIRAAYERSEYPQQASCPCCYDDCAAVVETERTGQCETNYGPVNALKRCEHYGSYADGGLCEDCYVATK